MLFAAGRTPNTEGLGLEQAGVRLDARGRIVVDRYYRTTAPGIYAAGDVVEPGARLERHAARTRGSGPRLRTRLRRGDRPDPKYRRLRPTRSRQRRSDRRADAATGIPYVVGRCDLATTARGAIAGHGGLLKLIFRADDRKLLGVHCFGDIASEVVGLGHVVLQLGGSVELFLTLALNTPTYSYAYHDAAVDGLVRLAGRWDWRTVERRARRRLDDSCAPTRQSARAA